MNTSNYIQLRKHTELLEKLNENMVMEVMSDALGKTADVIKSGIEGMRDTAMAAMGFGADEAGDGAAPGLAGRDPS